MKKMITLYADEGNVLTDGEIFATTISLADGRDGAEIYEISEAEARKLQEEKEAEDEE